MTDDAKPSPPANDNGAVRARAVKPCPVCGRPATAADSPFCSRRCADVDLNRWLGGVYRVPVDPADEDTVPEGE